MSGGGTQQDPAEDQQYLRASPTLESGDPASAAWRPSRMLRVVDAVGLALFGVLVLFVGRVVLPRGSVDLLVYHLAVGHICADDIYLHLYPQWPFTYPPSALVLMLPLGLPWDLARVLLYLASVASVWATGPPHCPERRSWDALGKDRAGVAAGSSWPDFAASHPRSGSWPGLAGGHGTHRAWDTRPPIQVEWSLGGHGKRDQADPRSVRRLLVVDRPPTGRPRCPGNIGWVDSPRGRVASRIKLVVFRWRGHRAYGCGVCAGRLLHRESSPDRCHGEIRSDSPSARLPIVLVGVALLFAAMLVARQIHRAGWVAAAVALVGVWSSLAVPISFVHSFGWWVPLSVAIGLTGRRPADLIVALIVYVAPFFLLLGPDWQANTGGIASAIYASNHLLLAVGVTAWLWWRVQRPASIASATHAVAGQVLPDLG